MTGEERFFIVTDIAITAVAEILNVLNKLNCKFALVINPSLIINHESVAIEFLSRYTNILKLAGSPTSSFTILVSHLVAALSLVRLR